MSSCEKCWSEAHDGSGDVAGRYAELIEARKDNQCTPEQQAGPDARECPRCSRKTIHQWTAQPMCGCPRVDSITGYSP